MARARSKVTGIRQVAERCGVSAATVSLAFSGKRPVTESLRKKIFRAAEELRYEPNQWARNMLWGKTQVIGLITDTLTNPFTARLVETAEEVARERGYQIWPAITGGDEGQGERYLTKFRQLRVDGYIVLTRSILDGQIDRMIDLGLNVVTPIRPIVGRRCNPVHVDFSDGIRQVVKYLYGLGHRRAAFIAGPQHDITSVERLKAFREWTRRLGMAADERLVAYGGQGVGSGRQRTEELLARVGEFTALMSSNDQMALEAIGTLARHGRRVPHDVSVTGFDDIPECELWYPRLTSVSFDLATVMQTTVTQLIVLIEAGTPITETRIKPRLAVRDSCRRILP
jgi:LacI family transcriptional regulator